MTEALDGARLVGMLVGHFGWRRAAEVLGTVLVWGAMGLTREDVDQAAISRSSWFRVRRDMQRFREAMKAAGRWPAEWDTQSSADDVRLWGDAAADLAARYRTG